MSVLELVFNWVEIWWLKPFIFIKPFRVHSCTVDRAVYTAIYITLPLGNKKYNMIKMFRQKNFVFSVSLLSNVTTGKIKCPVAWQFLFLFFNLTIVWFCFIVFWNRKIQWRKIVSKFIWRSRHILQRMGSGEVRLYVFCEADLNVQPSWCTFSESVTLTPLVFRRISTLPILLSK